MNRTLLDECFRVQGRQTWYIGPDESNVIWIASCATTIWNAAIKATDSRDARQLRR